MQPHQQRVSDEKAELDERIGKLGAFIHGDVFPTLPGADQLLLIEQHSAMIVYSEILAKRIARFA